VLDMTNIVGAAVAAVCLMLYYLPLDLERLRDGEDGARGEDPGIRGGDTAEAEAPAAGEAQTGA